MNVIKFHDNLTDTKTYARSQGQGSISIGGFSEAFIASLRIWTKLHYRMQWMEALHNVLAGNSAALVLDWSPSRGAKNLYGLMMPLYPIGRKKYAMRQNLIMKEFCNEGQIKIPQRIKLNADGEKISEWMATDLDLEELFDSISTHSGQSG